MIEQLSCLAKYFDTNANREVAETDRDRDRERERDTINERLLSLMIDDCVIVDANNRLVDSSMLPAIPIVDTVIVDSTKSDACSAPLASLLTLLLSVPLSLSFELLLFLLLLSLSWS
jgi:hypothetical protein